MSRGIVGNWVMCKIMMILVAFVLASFGASAFAQDVAGDSANWRFQNLDVRFYASNAQQALPLTATHGVGAASAILSASDSGVNVFKNRHDGSIVHDTAIGQLLSNTFYSVPGNRDRGPILANIERGENLNMVAVLNNVNPSIVSAIRSGNTAIANDVIARITAEFSRELFGFNKPRNAYASVHPTSVTGIPGLNKKSPSDLGFGAAPLTAYATMVVLRWDSNLTSPPLIADATEPRLAARGGFSATVGINGGVNILQRGPSNLVGIEPRDDKGNHSGPALSYTSNSGGRAKVDVQQVYDTISKFLFNTALTPPSNLPTFDGDSTNSFRLTPHFRSAGASNPIQYRSRDVVAVTAEIIANANLDGEPDSYFGPNSDPLLFGSGAAFNGNENPLNADGRIDTTDAFLQVTVQTPSAKTVNDKTSSTANFVNLPGSPASPSILSISFPVSNSLVTSGPHEYFTLSFVVRDDVGHATNAQTQNNVYAVDTIAPVVSDVGIKAVGSPNTPPDQPGFVASRVISTVPGYNAAILEVGTLSNGERLDRIGDWFNLGAKADPGQAQWTAGGTVIASTQNAAQNFVPNIPSGETLGVTSTVKLINTEKATIRNANLIVSVSDDARNPAFAWFEVPNPETTPEGQEFEVRNYNGSRRIPRASFNTNESFIGAFSETSFKTVANATLSVDNNPPHVVNAELSVTAMPRNYWTFASSGSTAGAQAFNVLRGASETLNNALNNETNGIPFPQIAANVLAASPVLLDVTRGTAAVTSTQLPITRRQSGSPVKLVVQFDPAGLGPDQAEDVGGRGFDRANRITPLSQSAMNDYFKNNFVFSVASSDMGWVTSVGSPLPSGWSLLEGTIVTVANAPQIAIATLVNTAGIPTSLDANGLLGSDHQELFVTVADRVRNYPFADPASAANIGKAALSNDILVDVSPAIVDLIGGQTVFAGGLGAPASTVVMITDTQNLNIDGLKSLHGRNYRSAGTSAFTLSQNRTASGFRNYRAIGAPPAQRALGNQVQAGQMIVVSANFTEPGNTGDASDNLFSGIAANGSTVAFPYLLGLQGAAGSAIDARQTKAGEIFRTISADFSDFILDAKDVLPDVTRVSGGGGIGAAAEGDVIEATWYFLINSERPINGAIGKNTIRNVTLIARDLSGNVSFQTIPLATAEFTIPVVAIENFEIHIPNRGINRATIQKQPDWNVPAGIPNAFEISAATVNLENATLTLVASVTNGPFTSNPAGFITADFRQVGGAIQTPSVPPRFLDGSSPASATSDTVVWATFTTGPLDGLENMTAIGAEIIVTATANTLAAGQARSEKIDADQNNPDVFGGQIFEQDLNGNRTAGDFDQPNDNVIRPNQTITAHAGINLDPVERLSVGATVNNINILGDFSNFGIGSLRSPNVIERNGNILDATWLVTVPSDAPNAPAALIVRVSDSAGNDTVFGGTQVFVNGSRPVVLRNVLSASHVIGHPTDSFHLLNQYYQVGQNQNGTKSFANINGTRFGRKTMVKAGDKIRLSAQLNISDPAFSDLSVWADMSEVLGPGFELTPHDPITGDPQTTGKVVSGGIVDATWTRTVNNVVKNATQAKIIVNATNGARIDAAGIAKETVNFVVDNIAPEVAIAARYFQGKDEKTDLLIPSRPEGATAQVIVYATLTDADRYHGFIGSPVAGANDAFDKGVGFVGAGNPADYTADERYREAQKSLVALLSEDFVADKFLLPDFWALSGKAGAWRDSDSDTDGPVVTGGASVNSASSYTEIRESTNTVLTAWYGVTPRTPGFIANQKLSGITLTKTNKAAARFVAYVSDTIGNRGSASSGNIEVDGVAPEVNSAAIRPATIVIADGTTPHIPAKYNKAGNTINSVTRVGPGSRIRTVFNVKDNPVPNQPITVSVEGPNFGIEDKTVFSVLSGNATIDSIVQRKGFDVAEMVITPTNSNRVVIGAEMTATGSGNNTFPIVTFQNNPLNAGFGYPGNPVAVASPINVYATDSHKNTRFVTSNGLDFDNEGPRFLRTAGGARHFSVVGINSIDAVRNLRPNSGILSSNNMNLTPGQWIVVAGTVVVDGTESEHFRNFSVDWRQAFEQDIARLVNGSEEQGSVLLTSSATRAVRFITAAIQIRSNASPSNPAKIRVFAEDFFGNNLENADFVETGFVAISAQGPRATEIELIVDGKRQLEVGTSSLGMGNAGPDATLASFEVQPGTMFEVEAIINTVGGRAPQTIVADFSDLYPGALKESVNEIVPSATEITPEGTVRAIWRYIASDYTGILSIPGGKGQRLRRAFNDIDLVSPELAVQLKNGLLKESTPSNATVIDTSGFIANNGKIGVGVDQQVIDRLMGLPMIKVQPNAAARTVARITVTVNELPPLNLFGPTQTPANNMAVDTRTPIASIQMPPELIVRDLPASEFFTAGPRIGFPSGPNLANFPITGSDAIPNRVRGGDVAYFVVDITNELINRSGDDLFRELPGIDFDPDTIFSLADDPTILDVSADLSDFTEGLTDVISPDEVPGSDPAFNVLSLVPQEGKATIISVTFASQVSGGIGQDVPSSRKLREVTPTVVDDAGNRPYNTFFNNAIKRIIKKKEAFEGGSDRFWNVSLGVDNAPPSISGALDVVIQSGEATGPAGQTLSQGMLVPAGSTIGAGAILTITASVNEQVDSPLDVLNNPNYGPVALTAGGIQIPAGNIILRASTAKLSGNSVLVPFDVRIPQAQDGFSTDNFRFIISASDTLGNSRSRESTDAFQFDAKPNLSVFRTGGTETPQGEVIVHAGDPNATELLASAFDVGGVVSVAWDVTPPAENLLASGVVITSDFLAEDGAGPKNLELPMTVEASITDIDNIAFAATASAIDVDGNETVLDPLGIIVNQPALLSSSFPLTITSSAGQQINDATALIGDNTLSPAGADIREVTMAEGSVLDLEINASDVNASDTVVVDVTGSAVTSDMIESVVYENGILSFVPGYMAVSGDVEKATYDLTVTAWDGRHTLMDYSSVLVNVTAQSATPELEVVSVTIGDATSAPTLFNRVEIPENDPFVVVLRGTDAGGEELSFAVETDTPAQFEQQVTSATPGIIDATVIFTPDSEGADIPPIFDSPIDPTIFTYTVANSSVETSAFKQVDIINVSQGAVITTLVSVDGSPQREIDNNATVSALAGQTVTINFIAEDPDFDRQLFPEISAPVPTDWTRSESTVRVEDLGVLIETQLVIGIADDVLPDASRVRIDYSIEDITGSITRAQYFVQVTPTSGIPSVDEIAVSQGPEGTNLVNVRNFDANAGVKNAVLPEFTYRSSNPTFLAAVGGGEGRASYITIGDVDNDGVMELVDSFGPVTEEGASFPNIVIPREADTKLPVGHSFHAFPTGTDNPARYNGGELRTAVGDFKEDGTNLLAVAQGVGSASGVVRLFQNTGNPAPANWAIVGQFQALDDTPTLNNANGGVTLAAGDVDGDGVDEILAGQTPSDSSLTQFTVLDIDATGNFPSRRNFVGFPAGFRGTGGVELAVGDINGDGQAEILAAGMGTGETGEVGSLISTIVPVVSEDNQVTGFTRPTGLAVFKVIGDDAINPQGGLRIDTGELDGDPSNGVEIVFSSGEGAPQSFYRVLKLEFDGSEVSGFNFLIGPPKNLNFVQPAFVDEFNPASGAVDVSVGNVRGN